jgi:hypothetical protein
MAQRQAGEAQAVVAPARCSVNEGLRASSAIGAQRDLVRAQGLDGLQQLAHLARSLSSSPRVATSSNGCVTRSR